MLLWFSIKTPNKLSFSQTMRSFPEIPMVGNLSSGDLPFSNGISSARDPGIVLGLLLYGQGNYKLGAFADGGEAL